MIIEFLGNSGSGKSTLIPMLAEHLRANGFVALPVTEAIHHYMRKTLWGRAVGLLVPPAWQGPILWRVFSYLVCKMHIGAFAARNPRLVTYVVTSQLRRRIPWQHRWLIVRLFLQMAGYHHFLRSRAQPGDVLVFDEGFVHRAVHLFVSEAEGLEPDRIAAYLRLLPQSDIVVRVQTPLDVCLARIRARGLQVRLRRLGPAEVAQFVANAEQVVNVVSQVLKSAGWQVVEVENSGGLEVCAADLYHHLERLLPVP